MRTYKNLPLLLSVLIIATLLAFFGVKSFSSFKSESSKMAQKYESLSSKYDALLKERNALRLKIEDLDKEIKSKNKQLDQYISEIQNSKLTAEQLSEHKLKVSQLIVELDDLIQQKKRLDYEFAKEKFNHYKSNEKIKDLEVDIMDLEEKNATLKSSAKAKKRPYVYSVNVQTFDEKRDYVLVSTDKARKVDVIQTCINMKSLNYALKNDIYFQILSPELTTVQSKSGSSKTQYYTKKIQVSSLNALENYCFEVNIDDENQKLKKGKYILNVFDEDVLISRAFFTLR